MIRNYVILAIALLGLSACETAEFVEEKNFCTADWMSKIPQKLEQETYNETKSRDVPTGKTVCTQSGTTTICEDVMRTEYYTVPAVRTVDRNKPLRDARIQACTQQICTQKYGNAQCEV